VAIPVGFEPTATSLEGRCSIQLSYGTGCGKGRKCTRPDGCANGPRDDPSGRVVGVAGFEPAAPWSQTRCATGLRHTPNGPSCKEHLPVGGATRCTDLPGRHRSVPAGHAPHRCKRKRPGWRAFWRRGGDSNPRYRLSPYGSLANYWFKPLTHLSKVPHHVRRGRKDRILPQTSTASPTPACTSAHLHDRQGIGARCSKLGEL
jgi:hypothetical protein